MDFKYTVEQEEFRKEIRTLIQSDPELLKRVRHEEDSGIGWGPQTWKFMQKVGAKGYLTPSWPKKYGGLDKTPLERHIAAEELSYHVGQGAFGCGLGMAGPVILQNGSQEQKDTYLPKIARAEIEFALGYTEPQSGSDLASLETRAVRDGDHYIINGQKVFNTSTHYSHYHWLAARTDQDAPKHRGISMFIVDLKNPGLTVSPLTGMGKVRTNEVFYDDVKVPVSQLVGEENKGWQYLVAALSYERNWFVGNSLFYLESYIKYLQKTKRNGQYLIDDPVLKKEVGQLAIDLEVVRLFGLRISCMLDKGTIPSYEAAMTKVFGSETWFQLLNSWLHSLNLYGQLDADSERVIENGAVMQGYFLGVRSLLTRGTNDIMKNMIAINGLGLPRK